MKLLSFTSFNFFFFLTVNPKYAHPLLAYKNLGKWNYARLGLPFFRLSGQSMQSGSLTKVSEH